MAWPNGPDEITPFPGSSNLTSETNLTTWTVYPYFKKSCEGHELWSKGDMIIRHKTGFRWGNFIVETNDGNPPEFEFGEVPGGNGAKDSIDMYNCYCNNIESVELDSMTDGCWDDIDWPEEMDDSERERLEEALEEGSVYEVLEDQEGWMLNESEAWIWGPIAIENEDGKIVRIIEADENGNVVIKTEEDYN